MTEKVVSIVGNMGRMVHYAFNSLDMTSSANDVIVIQHADGTLHSNPFVVRFGMVKLPRPQDKIVTVEVNGVLSSAVMKVGADGNAFWVEHIHQSAGSRSGSNPDSPMESPPPNATLRDGTNGSATLPPPLELEVAAAAAVAEEPSASPTSMSPHVAAAAGVRLDDPEPAVLVEQNPETLKGLVESLAVEEVLANKGAASQGDGADADSAGRHSSTHSRTPSVSAGAANDTPAGESPGDRQLDTPMLRLSRFASMDHMPALLDSPGHGSFAAVLAAAAANSSNAPKPPLAPDASVPAARGDALPAAAAAAAARADDDAYSSSSDGGEVLGCSDDDAGDAQLASILGRTTSGGGVVRQTLTPPHSELVKLKLRDGMNTVKYIVGSSLRGKVVVEGRIFLWPATAKIVVSDIDGTVTKSDVMGHICAYLRKDWTHPGLCQLYTSIAANGYKFLYLTARSVAQVDATRNYLHSILQDNGKRLPDGPVLTAPDKLFAALTQELSKQSHEFKIACLNQVRAAFPKHVTKPFYAGFGNRMGDVVAYTAASVPQHKIFIINKDSVVHVCSVHQTYRNLSHMVDITFPPLATPTTTAKLMEFHESRRQLAKATAIANAERRRHGDKADDAMSPLLARTNASPTGVPQFHADPAEGRRSSSPDSGASDEEDASASATVRERTSSGMEATHVVGAAGGIEHDAEAYYNEHEAAVAEMQAEEDFNSFNFWRVPPSAMVEPRRPVVAAPQVAAQPAIAPTAPPSADPQETGRSWAFWRRQHSTTPKK